VIPGDDGNVRTPVVAGGRTRMVPLREVDQELRAQWRTLDEESRRVSGQGMLRLREVNLVAVCSEDMVAEVQRTAALVAREHPARVIIVVAGPPAAGGPSVAAASGGAPASIATSCAIGGSSDLHVCSEQVVVRAPRVRGGFLQAAVAPLLVLDIPVVGWWVGSLVEGDLSPGGLRGSSEPDGTEWQSDLELLGRVCDQVVTDLCCSLPVVAAAEVLADLATGALSGKIREMEWLRFEPWRVLTAELFEQPERRALIPTLTSVQVEHHAAPLQGLFYAAWFASRLKLEPEGPWSNTEQVSTVKLVGAEGRRVSLELRLSAAVAEAEAEPGLTGVLLHSPSYMLEPTDEVRTISVKRSPLNCVCSARLGSGKDESVVKSVRAGREEESALLARIIDTPFPDRVLAESLCMMAALMGLPGFPVHTMFTVGTAGAPADPDMLGRSTLFPMA
jgi:glucose-6-phosphate dehydrogenase assembly protein OpcA